jgi:hypothetical protein
MGADVHQHHLWFQTPISFTESLDFLAFEAGPSMAFVGSNFQSRPEIGVYEWALPEGEFEKLRAAMARANLAAIPTSQILQPDERSTHFAETHNGGASFDMKSFTAKEMTPALRDLASLFVTAAVPLLAHPKKVLKGERIAGPVSLSSGEPVVFAVRFSNIGTDPVTISNPFRAGNQRWTGLRLHVRADKPAHALDDTDQLSVDLPQDAIRLSPPDAQPSSAGRLTLSPGQSIELSIRKSFRLTPGRYLAALTFITSERPQTQLALDGSLTVDLGSFEAVTGKTPAGSPPTRR